MSNYNLKNNKWFIRVKNEQEAVAVQKWAFEQGLSWSGDQILRDDFHTWEGKVCNNQAIGFGHFGVDSLGQAGSDYWIRNEHDELFINFELIVGKVEYPEVPSRKRQIKELEETIAKASAQIAKLKEGM